MHYIITRLICLPLYHREGMKIIRTSMQLESKGISKMFEEDATQDISELRPQNLCLRSILTFLPPDYSHRYIIPKPPRQRCRYAQQSP